MLPDLALVAGTLGANLKTEADVSEAGRLMRGAIGAHPSAWLEACESLGAFRASCLVLIVAQLHDDETRRGEIRIKNPGRVLSSARAHVRRRPLQARIRADVNAPQENDVRTT